ncbi:MAG TPA: ester cyclase [Gemmatimonadales bacterium]|nr:ester cyclase [Gemmatimonadales bacterium]
MSVERTREAMMRYWDSHHRDLSMMAPDVHFTTMATGDEHCGVEEVRRMLDHIYHVAFDARAELRTRLCTESHAVIEGWLVGTHVGEFAGVPATGRQVRVPLCVVYDVEDGLIKRGRVYLELPVLLRQLRGEAAVAEVGAR